jgi:hypothetical protein
MATLRQSVSCVLAASVLTAAASCRDVTEPETVANGSSAALAKKPAPPKTGTLRLVGNTSWSVSLAWDASAGAASYRLRDNWGREIVVPGTQTSVTWKYPTHPPLHNGATYSFSMYAVDASGTKSGTSNTVTANLPLDHEAPTVPAFTVTSVGTRHISLVWSSTDDSPYMSYQVFKDGVKVHSSWISATSRTFTLLQPGTTYTFTAVARDYLENVSGGNTSALSPGFSVTTRVNDGSDVTAPTQPSPVFADLYDGSTEIQVSWGASTDAVTPGNVILYEMYVNGVHENSAIGTTQTTGYGVPGENVITVIAIDEAGNRSTAGRTTLFIPF